MIKINIICNHDIIREGLKSIIGKYSNSIKIVHFFTEISDAFSFSQNTSIDIYIIDMLCSTMEKFIELEKVLKTLPNSKIILIIDNTDPLFLKHIYGKGIKGLILKKDPEEYIIDAINIVFKGNYYLTPSLSQLIVEEIINFSPNRLKKKGNNLLLTTRERQILQAVCQELSDKEIASKLKISVNTVHVHKKRLMKKLNIHSTLGLALYAIKNGLATI